MGIAFGSTHPAYWCQRVDELQAKQREVGLDDDKTELRALLQQRLAS